MLAFASSATDEFQAALTETGITARPQPPSFGERAFDPYFLDDVKKLPADRKEKLAAQIAQLTPRLARERFAQPIPRGIGPALGILLLQDIGTDEQKINAFRNLDLYGNLLSWACEALATCEGPEGVRILKQYAESQFDYLAKYTPRTTEGEPAEKPDVNIYHAIIALAGAYHPDGPVAADRLRDRFIEIAKIRLSADRLAAVEKEFEKDMKKARHERESILREKRPNNKRNSKVGNMNTEASGTIADSSSRVINSKWFWLSTAALLLVLAYWFIWKRKS